MTLASIDARSGNVLSSDNNKKKGPESASTQPPKVNTQAPVQVGPAVKVQLESKSSGASAPKSGGASDSSDKAGPSNQIATDIASDSGKLDSVA